MLKEPVGELLRRHVWMTFVAGVTKYPTPERWSEPGDRLLLRREPDNPVDSNAVSVWTDTEELFGYLPARRAAEMDDVPREGIVLAEMRVDGHRVSLWMLVSREPVSLVDAEVPASARAHVERQVRKLKEAGLAVLAPAPPAVNPMHAMRRMFEDLGEDRRGPGGAADLMTLTGQDG